MKKVLRALLICMLLYGCDLLTELTEPERCSISVTITSREQNYYEYSQQWGNTEVYYNVTNTSNTDVDYYKVYFKVTCADGTIFHKWDNGLDLPVGRTLSDWTLFSTAGKRVTSVMLDGTEADCY